MRLAVVGGGTAGHILPCIAVIEEHRDRKIGLDALYIGERGGKEEEIALRNRIPFKGISTGKFRRYFSFRNFTDPFRVIKGFFEARKILKEAQIEILFSKSGYVSVPVALAAASLRIPVVLHESDASVSLSGVIQAHFAKRICVSFESTFSSIRINGKPIPNIVMTGNPIRKEILNGDIKRGLYETHFDSRKPVVMVMGGSLGAQPLNKVLCEALPELQKHAQIIHLYGPGNAPCDAGAYGSSAGSGYYPREYVEAEELRNLYAITDLIVSRAGAGAVYEILALKKPSILIPLGTDGSRGEQLQNARALEDAGAARVIEQNLLSAKVLVDDIAALLADRQALNTIAANTEKFHATEGAARVADQIIAVYEEARAEKTRAAHEATGPQI